MTSGARRLRDLDPRPGPWDASSLAERPCPICGGAGEERFVRPDDLRVRCCAECGTWFVSPAPGEEQLASFYRAYHQRHRVEAFRGTRYHERTRLPSFEQGPELARRIRSRRAADDLRVRELASAIDLSGARALDVGCGTGQLLWFLQSLGAEPVGVDVDPAAVEFVRDQLGLAVHRGMIDAVVEPGSFDLVALQDILEHVLDPRGVLERAVRLLRPGGLLYLWTPNATYVEDEPEPQVFRADFEHLQFLSARTVAHLAGELGLELLHLESVGHLRSGENGRAPSRPGPGPGPGPGQGQGGFTRGFRGALRRLPVFDVVNRARLALRDRYADRAGNYQLLVLLRKPR